MISCSEIEKPNCWKKALIEINELPEFPNLRRLRFEDKALLDSLFRQIQPNMSELTFTNLYVWNETESVQLTRVGDSVLLLRRRLIDNSSLFFPPIGKQPTMRVLRQIEKAMIKNQPETSLYSADTQEAQQLAKEGYTVKPDRKSWDYVYLSSDLANLPGDKYHSKRNFISRCLQNNNCEYKKIDLAVVNECLKLQTEWCNLRKCDALSGLEAENNAIKTTFNNYQQLSVMGGAIYVKDKLEAFTIAEPLNNETAVIHFEKANPEITGLYQLINQWFCKNALTVFNFINREQDLGIPGLRNAKQSYHPHHMVEKYLTPIPNERIF